MKLIFLLLLFLPVSRSQLLLKYLLLDLVLDLVLLDLASMAVQLLVRTAASCTASRVQQAAYS